MRKLFKYEINESIAAKAAMNCLKNRNNPKKLNETSEFDARFEFRKDLRELASPAAKKAYMIIRKQYGDSMWRQLGMDDCDEQGLIDMLNMYAEDGLKPQQIVNKMMGVQEQEEDGINKGGMHNLVQVGHIMNTPSYNDDDEFVPYKNTFDETHKDVVDTLNRVIFDVVGNDDSYNGFDIFSYTDDQVGKAIEQVLDKHDDFPTNNYNSCAKWIKKHEEELVKVLETGSLDNSYEGHPEFDFSEQEEMEVTDAKHALAEMVATELRYPDGNLDEIYDIISDIIAKEGYSPSPDEYDDWFDGHIDQIQDLVM